MPPPLSVGFGALSRNAHSTAAIVAPPSIHTLNAWSSRWPMHRPPASAIKFISLYGWYDVPLTSRDSDRRHHPWPVYDLPMCRIAPHNFSHSSCVGTRRVTLEARFLIPRV